MATGAAVDTQHLHIRVDMESGSDYIISTLLTPLTLRFTDVIIDVSHRSPMVKKAIVKRQKHTAADPHQAQISWISQRRIRNVHGFINLSVCTSVVETSWESACVC